MLANARRLLNALAPAAATALIASMSLSDENLLSVFGPDFGVGYFRQVAWSLGLLFTIISLYLANTHIIKMAELSAENGVYRSENRKLKRDLDSARSILVTKDTYIAGQKSEAFNVIHDMLGKLLLEKAHDIFDGEPPSDFRLTVYSHRQDTNTFSQVGRYSPRPLFNQVGRKSYSLKGGAIGEAWQMGSSDVDKLPDPELKPDAYRQVLVSKWQMREEEVDGLRMKSRAMRALRIKGGDNGKEPVGVLLVETTRASLSEGHQNLLQKVFADYDGLLKRVIHYEYELHKKIGGLET